MSGEMLGGALGGHGDLRQLSNTIRLYLKPSKKSPSNSFDWQYDTRNPHGSKNIITTISMNGHKFTIIHRRTPILQTWYHHITLLSSRNNSVRPPVDIS